MSQVLFGISGYAKSGKTTIASLLAEMGATEISFADHLKNVCSSTFNIPREHFDEQSLKEVPFSSPISLSKIDTLEILEKFNEFDDEKNEIVSNKHVGVHLKSPRHIAQYVGTDILRAIDPEIHVKTAFRKIDGLPGVFIVPDMRFFNEFEAIKSRNGITIGINRKSVAPDLKSVHESERQIASIVKKCDFVLDNNGSLEKYQKDAKDLICRFFPDYRD